MRISREIYLTSPIPKPNSNHLPMIEFEITANSLDLGGVDTLMFTSKQAVSSAEAIDSSWKSLPSIAIGPATQKRIEELGGEVIYRPKEFYGSSLAKDIVEFFADRKILYIRPEVVSFDSKGFLKKHGVDIKEQIIYKTSCKRYKKDDAPEDNSIIIFTSPSTIHCFLENFGWKSSYIAVVIGKATLEHLPKGAKYAVADSPSIDFCVKKALEINKN